MAPRHRFVPLFSQRYVELTESEPLRYNDVPVLENL
jgi:hypothetical protein